MKRARAAAERLGHGCGTLACDFGHWLLPGHFGTACARFTGTSVGGVLAWTVVDRAPGLLWLGAAAGLAGAWRAGAPADGQEQPAIGGEAVQSGLSWEQLLAALHQAADPHAHLSTVAALVGSTTGAVRAALDEAAVPVAGGVRAGGRVSTGVRAADIPPLPDPSPGSPGAVVVAGQPSNNNTDSRRPYLSREGYLTTPDPARPHGWHVSQGR